MLLLESGHRRREASRFARLHRKSSPQVAREAGVAPPGAPLAGFASSSPDCLGEVTAFTNTTAGTNNQYARARRRSSVKRTGRNDRATRTATNTIPATAAANRMPALSRRRARSAAGT